ncbi:hypothetical protein ACIA8R_52600 [Nonomuraea sp. NPDC051191]|uniref:hypothetical protein n=1 Tax=Nonomuraea sp. NPDC051191 TaxID=3364372 RepID=UPI003795E016
MRTNIDHLVARFAAAPVTEVSDGARELMHAITAEEPPAERVRRKRLGWRLAAPATALVAAGLLAVNWVLPMESGLGPAPAAALDIERENGFYVIKINDLYANPAAYQAQLRAAGLDITLRVVPETGAYEGRVFPVAPGNKYVKQIKGIYPAGGCDRTEGCALGVKIPIAFAGKADITIGRKAKPGEPYRSITRFDAKGEPLYCVPYKDKTVAEVRRLLAERGVHISDFTVQGPEGSSDPLPTVPDGYFVQNGFLTEPRKALVYVTETQLGEVQQDC